MSEMMNTVDWNGRVITPSKIVCVGRNYAAHIEELNNAIPDQMVIFSKHNSSISNTLHASLPQVIDYEAELSFLIMNKTIVAVAAGLDLTKRDVQSDLKEKSLPWDRSKAFDGSALFSPFVSIDQVDPALQIELQINGNRVQSGSIDLMINKPQHILEEILGFMTLNDGDIVMTGTPKGVGAIEVGSEYHARVVLHDRVLTEAR